MAESTAWVLNLHDSLSAAVGEKEMLHLIEVPTLLEIPTAPFYCRHVLIWEDNILPAMDLAAWLANRSVSRQQTLAGVFAYQERSGTTPRYGALLLASIPRRQRVSDEQACELPEQAAGWEALAISCFAAGDNPIPILDLPRIFSNALLKDWE